VHVDVNGNILSQTKHVETHFPDPTALKILEIKHNIKKAALTTRDLPQAIVADATATASDATAARLPLPRSLKRGVRRVKESKQHEVPLPTDLKDLQIPEALKKTLKGDHFLLHDSGANTAPNRIIIFCTRRFFDHIVSVNEVYADGTFKLPPSLFQQLYVMHGYDEDDKFYLPCVYALLPNKTKPTYKLMLQVLLLSFKSSLVNILTITLLFNLNIANYF